MQVNDQASLSTAIQTAASGDTIQLTSNITLTLLDNELPAVQTSVTIDGSGFSLSGNVSRRCLFIGKWSPGGTEQLAVDVTVQDLTLTGCRARGGGGGDGASGGGGGGAGLGGAMFVASGADVTLSNVTLSSNSAVGGSGGEIQGSGVGGGGGMGGSGGNGSSFGAGSGGGGLDAGARGGVSTSNGLAGVIALGAAPGGQGNLVGASNICGNSKSAGGANGGGGGGSDCQGAGGGGVGGQVNSHQPPGGAGGFGGGGGGGSGGTAKLLGALGGPGGLGGGGGAPGGVGGFGGGGGGNLNVPGIAGAGAGGFGGGAGSLTGGGGGGLAAGGAVFVQSGGTLTFAGPLSVGSNVVLPGPGRDGASPGSAFGRGIFISGNNTVTFSPPPSVTQTVSDTIADEHGSVASFAGSGGLIVNGAGTLELCGAHTYSGQTDVVAGTLEICGTGTINSEVLIRSGGTLVVDGGGTVDGNVTVRPGGTLVNNGTVTGTIKDFNGPQMVSSDLELREVVANGATPITFAGNILLTADTPSFLPTTTVNIDGAGFSIDGADAYRCFFIGAWEEGTATQAPVSVTIENLTLESCRARGGTGGQGGGGGGSGGGGAGLGGAIFVANQATVTLANDSFISNKAAGGNGASFIATPGDRLGGGGGMGGNGGNAGNTSGAGGGLGVGANGGSGVPTNGAAGIATGARGGGSACAGSASAGVDGGGGAGSTSFCPGGGGVGGGFGGAPDHGAGGFGGGGGGTGAGGFGGGGAAGGPGGFGGGGGGQGNRSGGFGGGAGAAGGGGGLGAGGAVFVQQGGALIFAGALSISGGTVGGGARGGVNADPGSAFGSGIFLHGDGTSITFSPAAAETQTVSDVIADEHGSVSADPDSAGLTKSGVGTLVLCATNTYTGPTIVNAGTLEICPTGSINSDVTVNSGGTLWVRSGGTVTGDVEVNSGGTLINNGTIKGTIGGDGTIIDAHSVAELSPASFDFGEQTMGVPSAPGDFTLSNTGDAPLAIADIAIDGPDATDFSRSDDCGGSVAAQSACTISVTFTPSFNVSTSVTLAVTDDSGGVLGQTQTATVFGTGTWPAGQTFVVTTLADQAGLEGGLSLREAIGLANADAVADTITFAAGLAGTITLDPGLADPTAGPSAFGITSPIRIDGRNGSAGITLDGDGAQRLFYVGPAANLTLDGLTLTGGLARGGNGGVGDYGGGGAAGLGGAIFSDQGTVIINGSTLAGNTAQGGDGGASDLPALFSPGGGGGLGGGGLDGGLQPFTPGAGGPPNGGVPGVDNGDGGFGGGGAGNFVSGAGNGGFGGGGGGHGNSIFTTGLGQGGGGDGAVEFFNGVIGGAEGGNGVGGAVFDHDGTLFVTNSTVTGNTAQGGNGGSNTLGPVGSFGLGLGGAIHSTGRLAIVNSTLSLNASLTDGVDTFARQVYSEGDLRIDNSILGQADTVSFPRSEIEASGTLSGAGNLIRSGILLGSTGTIESVSTDDPLLGPLHNYGGPTRTLIPLPGSPVIDAAPCTEGLGAPVTADQRGVARPQGASCDVGAFELREGIDLPPIFADGFESGDTSAWSAATGEMAAVWIERAHPAVSGWKLASRTGGREVLAGADASGVPVWWLEVEHGTLVLTVAAGGWEGPPVELPQGSDAWLVPVVEADRWCLELWTDDAFSLRSPWVAGGLPPSIAHLREPPGGRQ